MTRFLATIETKFKINKLVRILIHTFGIEKHGLYFVNIILTIFVK